MDSVLDQNIQSHRGDNDIQTCCRLAVASLGTRTLAAVMITKEKCVFRHQDLPEMPPRFPSVRVQLHR